MYRREERLGVLISTLISIAVAIAVFYILKGAHAPYWGRFTGALLVYYVLGVATSINILLARSK